MHQGRLQAWQRWNAKDVKLNDFNWLNMQELQDGEERLHWGSQEYLMLLLICNLKTASGSNATPRKSFTRQK
eukprot:6351470-Prorocentrum_lima.AAC.1